MVFNGFSSVVEESIPVPAVFFSELLLRIDSLGELRVLLYAFWSFSQQSNEPRFMRFSEMIQDSRLMGAFGSSRDKQEQNLRDELERACVRGTLLNARLDEDTYYFLNSERGKAARNGLMDGKWDPDGEEHVSSLLTPARPNIFALYEENIGPLTPIIADTLKEAEEIYSAEWINEAIKIAVVKNVRNWRYVEAILKDWKEKGRDGTDRRSAKENRKRDSEGEFADFVKH